MNLQHIYPALPQFNFICKKCGRMCVSYHETPTFSDKGGWRERESRERLLHRLNNPEPSIAYADLYGESFRDYYCGRCGKELIAAQEASHVL